MKKIVLISLIFLSKSLFSQDVVDYYIYFDGNDTNMILIDTISNPENIWQIAKPEKSFFNDVKSAPNVIVTDSKESYPVSDTSSFYILHPIGKVVYDLPVTITGYYKVDSDSLNDFGIIDFSLDRGETWISLLEDTTGLMTVLDPYNTVFTGKQDWEYFRINKIYDPMAFYDGEIDTVLYRFSFISDDIAESRDGLMFDNIHVEQVPENIISQSNELFSSEVFPNPSSSYLNIRHDNTQVNKIDLDCYDNKGTEVLSISNIEGNNVIVDISNLPIGSYYYRITDQESNKASFGKFIVVNR